MQHQIMAFYKKIIAVFMAFIASLGFSCGGDIGEGMGEIVRGEVNSISAYYTENADYTLTVDAADEVHEISDMLYGIFFEDINFAADGGLYAEKVINPFNIAAHFGGLLNFPQKLDELDIANFL